MFYSSTMPYVEMDPAVVMKLLEGYKDELSPEAKKLEAFYKQFICPRCGGACSKELLKNHAFADPDTLIPRAVLRCKQCSCLFDPFTGIRLEQGNIGKVQPDIPIIKPQDE